MIKMKITELIGFKFNSGHALFGVLLAIIFLVSNFAIAGFSLAVPVLPLSSTAGEYFISGFVMPIIEEVGFRVVLFWIFIVLLENFGVKNEKVRFYAALVLQAISFAGFHWFVYTVGGYVAKTSPFVAAFVFALLTGYTAHKLTKDISTAIVVHVIVNLVLLTTFSIV